MLFTVQTSRYLLSDWLFHIGWGKKRLKIKKRIAALGYMFWKGGHTSVYHLIRPNIREAASLADENSSLDFSRSTTT